MSTKATSSTLAKCAPDEPIFVLRAQDITAPDAILAWLHFNKHLLGTPKGNEALDCLLQMVTWQKEHGCKAAD